MSLLFFGYLLILLQLNVPIAGYNIDILFDFAGYYFLTRAATTLAGESETMKKTILPCKVMIAVSLAGTVCLTLGVLNAIPVVRSLVTVLLDLAAVGILYYQVKGVSEIEKSAGYLMKGHKLRRDWMILAVAIIASNISVYQTVAIIAAYAQLIFSIVLLLDLNFAIKNYNAQVMAPTPEEQAAAAAATAKSDAAAEPEIAFTAEEASEDEEA